MKFVIKCKSESGFGFSPQTDYTEFFSEGQSVATTSPGIVTATFPWGKGTFKFGEYVVSATFEYNSIDFGYTEPLMQDLAKTIGRLTGKPNKWWQVPNAPSQPR